MKPFISGGAPGELGGGVNNVTHNCEDVPETESESALLSFPAAEAGEALQLLIENSNAPETVQRTPRTLSVVFRNDAWRAKSTPMRADHPPIHRHMRFAISKNNQLPSAMPTGQ